MSEHQITTVTQVVFTVVTPTLPVVSASEQFPRRDHLDDARGEAGGLRPCPGQSDPLLHHGGGGLWEVLWADPDHLHAGNQTLALSSHLADTFIQRDSQ